MNELKHNKDRINKRLQICMSILILLFLNSCSHFNSGSQFQNINCDKKLFENYKSEIKSVSNDYLSCLKNNGRNEDYEWFNSRFSVKTASINIRCDIQNKTTVVLAERKTSRYYPGFNFSNKIAVKSDNINKIRSEIFHEFSHLKDEGHFKGYDLAEISDACCLDLKLSESHKKHACKMLKYKESDWTSSDYLIDYVSLMKSLNKNEYAYKNLVGALSSISDEKNNSKIFKTLHETLIALEKPYIKKKISRKERKEVLKSQEFYYFMILNSVLGLSADEIHQNSSINRLKTVKSRYLNNQIDSHKLIFFNQIASIYTSLLKKESELLRESWIRIKEQVPISCKYLDSVQISSVDSILSVINPLIFEHKNSIPAGEFYEIATYFSKPCQYVHSFESSGI